MCWCTVMPQIHYTRFPVSSPEMGKLPTCYRLVVDLLATWPTSPQQVVVMEFGKRHDTTDTTDFCPCQFVADLLRTCHGEVANFLRTCYGETGVIFIKGFWPLRIYSLVCWCVGISMCRNVCRSSISGISQQSRLISVTAANILFEMKYTWLDGCMMCLRGNKEKEYRALRITGIRACQVGIKAPLHQQRLSLNRVQVRPWP